MLEMYKEPEDLDEVLAGADEAAEPPPDPIGGIPKQWVPAWIRWPIRVFALPFVLLDLKAQKIARFFIRPPFKQVGSCLKRGNCCHYILLPEDKGIFGKLFYLWSTQFLGFYKRYPEVYESEGEKVYVMGCRYLSKEGKCTRYFLRPTVCRKWPLISYFREPRLLKGCGFKAITKNSTFYRES